MNIALHATTGSSASADDPDNILPAVPYCGRSGFDPDNLLDIDRFREEMKGDDDSDLCWECKSILAGADPIPTLLPGQMMNRTACAFEHEVTGDHTVTFYTEKAVALVPQSTDLGINIHWLPACEHHMEGHWEGADWGPYPFVTLPGEVVDPAVVVAYYLSANS